jgi:hypothetical protein
MNSCQHMKMGAFMFASREIILFCRPGQWCPGSTKQIGRKGKVMKTASFVLLLMASMAFVLVGCSDNSGPVGASTDQALSAGTPAAPLAKGVVLASASGSGQMYLDADGYPTLEKSDILRVCTFNAREYAGGSYSGEFITLGPPVPGTTFGFKGELLQVKVQGNKAKMIFKILSARGGMSGTEGFNFCYVVVDNGEGVNAQLPDMNTPFYLFDPADTQFFLDLTPDEFIALLPGWEYPGLVPLIHGNVQVQGNSY